MKTMMTMMATGRQSGGRSTSFRLASSRTMPRTSSTSSSPLLGCTLCCRPTTCSRTHLCGQLLLGHGGGPPALHGFGTQPALCFALALKATHALRSFVMSVQRIMNSEFQRCKHPRDFLRGTTFVSRLISSYTKYAESVSSPPRTTHVLRLRLNVSLCCGTDDRAADCTWCKR